MKIDPCRFKENLTDRKYIAYKVNELKGYGFFNDKFFLSKFLPASVDDESDEVFLKCLIKGTVSLYVYKSNFFVDKDNSPLYKLEEKIVNVKNDKGKSGIFIHKKYIFREAKWEDNI